MEAIAKFMEKEKEHDMFDLKYDDFYYWEYIRVFVSHEINRILSKSSPWFGKSKKDLKKYLIDLKQMKKYFLSNEQKNSDVLFISHPRRELEDDTYKNVYIDDMISHVSEYYKTLTVEDPAWCWYAPSDRAHKFPLYTDNIYFTDLIELKHLCQRFFFEKFNLKEYKRMLDEYEKVKSEVASWFPEEDMSTLDFKSRFFDAFIKYRLEYKDVERLIQKINPKVVLMHYYPTHLKMMLIEICKKYNIPTVEVQHGIITNNDPIINKSYDIEKMRIATDYMFAFGELVMDMQDSTVPKDRVKYIGFPYFEEKLNDTPDKPDILNNGKKHILIISQSAIGIQLSEFTSKLSDLIPEDYDIIFKYHPHELKSDYEVLKKKNITEVRDEYNIYQLLKFIDLEVGVFSTALFEGVAFGIPTLIVENIFGADEVIDMFRQLENGAYMINSPEEVLQYLGKENELKPTTNDIAKIWATDSLNNTKKEIEKILSKQK